MKKSFFALILLSFVQLCLHAQGTPQSTEVLKIKYTETIFMDANRADLPPQIAANMPKSRDMKKILYATPSQSLYIGNKEDKVEEGSREGRGEGRGRGFGGGKRVDSKIYCNYDELKVVTGTDLFGKEFVITEEKEYTWKIHSGEQRDILGYTCQKATYMKDTVLVTAWYAPKIQVPTGPDGVSGLPGAILALSEGENRVTLATSVEEKFPNPPAIEKPSKGEKITREEYEKVRAEKIKEMKAMYGNGAGGGRIQMIRG